MFAGSMLAVGMSAPLTRGVLGEVADSLTAAGTTQATAYPMQRMTSQWFSTVAAGAGAIIPTGMAAGEGLRVYNAGANSLTVYPPVGGEINALGANVGISVPSGSSIALCCMTLLRFFTIGGGSGGTPGGSDTQIQFNDGGAFGGNANLIFDKTTGVVYHGGIAGQAAVFADLYTPFGGIPSFTTQVQDAPCFNTVRGATASGNPWSPAYVLINSRGTLAVPLALQNGDLTGEVDFAGYDGANYIYTCAVQGLYGANMALILKTFTPTGTADESVAHLRSGLFGIAAIGGPISETSPAIKGGGAGATLAVKTYNDAAYAPLAALSLSLMDGNMILGTATGTKIGTATTQKLSFYNSTPVVQPVDGATLTNNVTSGGSSDVIANYTDLTIYANDAAAIRNDIYQLARKLKIVVDNLRTLGLES